jgi:hypothetical protein
VYVAFDFLQRFTRLAVWQARPQRTIQQPDVAAQPGLAGLTEFHCGRTKSPAVPQSTITR